MATVKLKAGVRMLCLFFLLMSPFSAIADYNGEEGWTRVDSIVATIENAPVLETDILMEQDLGLLESSRSDGGFDILLEAYLNRLLIIREIEEVGGFRLSAGQSEGAYKGYVQRYGSRSEYDAKLTSWGVGEQEVQGRLERALLASLYTESRIQFYVNVLPSDIEKAYEQDRERWGESSVYEVWETIRSELLLANYRQERDRWLKSLRDRYELIVYGPGRLTER